MNKINGKIAVSIVFLLLVILGVLYIQPIENKTTVNDELKVANLDIQFKEGITESEVKAILESCNMITNYTMDFDVDYFEDKYYITIGKGNWEIRDELSKEMKKEKKNWITSSPASVISKGDYHVFAVSEQATHDENFLAILDKYDVQVEKFTWCSIRFEDEFKNWIPEENAIRIKTELEKNENIFVVYLGYRC